MTTRQPRNDQIALVTGASSGIGRAIAEQLHQLGFKVYGASRSIGNAGLNHLHCLPMDVDHSDSVRDAITFIVEAEKRLDVVVNCAGSGLAGAMEDTSIEEAKAQFETNFFGVMRVCLHVLPVMRQQRSGLIVNVSSLAGLTGIPFQGLYSASKHALEGLTESLRMEVASFGIRVVLMEPGDFATNFTSQRRRTKASQVNPAYRDACDKAIARMEQDERSGPSPQMTARLLQHIVESTSPRLRYTTGRYAQRFGVGLKRVLPHRIYEKLLMQAYGLRQE